MVKQPQWRQSAQQYLKQAQEVYQSQEVVVKASFRLILSIFAVAFFAFFALRPTLGSISTLLKKIEDQKEVSSRLDTKITQLSKAEEVLSQRGDELSNLTNRAVPTEPQVDRLAQQMEAVANENEVFLTSVKIQKVPLFGKQEDEGGSAGGGKFTFEEKQKFVTFSFTVGGNQDNIVRFLGDLEEIERAVLLAQVSFDKPEKQLADQLPLIANGKGTIYYLPASNE